ncbi:ribosome small subunit-dependent GTPase A [Bacillus thermotolerans]|uniref:ribosome small subunit-dependent GTPase A n=1 Tax=Bacillus thermotolerans TaxID=1221996 RepID=UPI0005896355|nr:ribosome small subunit-dependent GTPase A [Bacillus thermotolerans]KKB43962.1 Ribosome small subunit-stimulated GTPase EngC [Bacillus thermotolerans]
MPKGKIVKALSGFYYVADGEQMIQCRGRGVFRKRKVSPLVGDYVEYQAENELEGYILAIDERENELIRPPIANVDQVILVFSAVRPDFSTALLDRFLVLVESKNIEPLICITKTDLLSKEEEDVIHQYAEQYRSIGYPVILTSLNKEEAIGELRSCLKGRTSVFAGQSGVGKSSLLNALKPELELKTNDISDSLGRGKHTTRHVELINVEDGLVADTPGFSSLELTEIEAEELAGCFPEMVEQSDACKFRGCLHVNEPKCAVKGAVESGSIPSYRYEHYLQFMDEIKERKPRY